MHRPVCHHDKVADYIFNQIYQPACIFLSSGHLIFCHSCIDSSFFEATACETALGSKTFHTWIAQGRRVSCSQSMYCIPVTLNDCSGNGLMAQAASESRIDSMPLISLLQYMKEHSLSSLFLQERLVWKRRPLERSCSEIQRVIHHSSIAVLCGLSLKMVWFWLSGSSIQKSHVWSASVGDAPGL